MTAEEAKFCAVLAAFKRAAVELDNAWAAGMLSGADGIANYPRYLPSFEEFIADVLAMEARIGSREVSR